MTDREEMELLVLKAELKNYKRWYFTASRNWSKSRENAMRR